MPLPALIPSLDTRHDSLRKFTGWASQELGQTDTRSQEGFCLWDPSIDLSKAFEPATKTRYAHLLSGANES